MITGWHRYRIPILPDGTCGVALDGKPIWRSRDILPFDVRYRVALSGNSARTTISAAGPLTVWQGVKQDIDWSTIPR